MTPSSLLSALETLIVNETHDITVGDEGKVVSVFQGYLPKKKAAEAVPAPSTPSTPNNQVFIPPRADDSHYPFIILRLLNGSDDDDVVAGQEGAIATVRLLFGTKSYDTNGYLDVLHLIQTVRSAILRSGTLDDRFRIQKPLTWTIYEDQPHPEWYGEMVTTWIIPTIKNERGNELLWN